MDASANRPSWPAHAEETAHGPGHARDRHRQALVPYFRIADDGVIVSRKVSRAKLVATVDCLDPRTVAMEACGSAHYWRRLFEAAGRTVQLINPLFCPTLPAWLQERRDRRAGNFGGRGPPTMRFVPVKSVACQDLKALHRVRDRLVHNRTSLINHTRGLLAEYGVVLPQGAKRFTVPVGQAVANAALSDLAREIFAELQDQLGDLDHRIGQIDTRLVAICRENAACRRLLTIPGIGPVVATALVAIVNDGRQFRPAVIWQPGSAWFRASTRLAASLSSAALVDGRTTIYAGRSCMGHGLSYQRPWVVTCSGLPGRG
jgi:transposase IS116/IS110/IS902 family protein